MVDHTIECIAWKRYQHLPSSVYYYQEKWIKVCWSISFMSMQVGGAISNEFSCLCWSCSVTIVSLSLFLYLLFIWALNGAFCLLAAAVQSYSSPRQRSAVQRGDYYSSFHGTPVQRFSRKEWKDFTRESTAEALAEWASSPEVTTWLVDNAHRVRLDPDPDRTSDDSLSDNSSGSSDETMVENGSQRGLLNWYWTLSLSFVYTAVVTSRKWGMRLS